MTTAKTLYVYLCVACSLVFSLLFTFTVICKPDVNSSIKTLAGLNWEQKSTWSSPNWTVVVDCWLSGDYCLSLGAAVVYSYLFDAQFLWLVMTWGRPTFNNLLQMQYRNMTVKVCTSIHVLLLLFSILTVMWEGFFKTLSLLHLNGTGWIWPFSLVLGLIHRYEIWPLHTGLKQ